MAFAYGINSLPRVRLVVFAYATNSLPRVRLVVIGQRVEKMELYLENNSANSLGNNFMNYIHF